MTSFFAYAGSSASTHKDIVVFFLAELSYEYLHLDRLNIDQLGVSYHDDFLIDNEMDMHIPRGHD